jgi:hypothetical protein
MEPPAGTAGARSVGRSEAYRVHHHGSSSSTTAKGLSVTRPRVGILVDRGITASRGRLKNRPLRAPVEKRQFTKTDSMASQVRTAHWR